MTLAETPEFQAVVALAATLRYSPPLVAPRRTIPLRPLADVEKEMILVAHEQFGADRKSAARALGVSASTYYRKLAQYGVARRAG